MIQLRKPVFVSDLDGYGAATTKAGVVVGISRMNPPRYDVLVDGKVLNNIEANRVTPIKDKRDIFGVVPK